MNIDRDTPIPLYYQLKEYLLDEIREKKVLPGDMLPTELEFTEKFGISRATVRMAIMELVRAGFLYRIKSKGTFVAYPKMDLQYVAKSPSYNEHMRQLGKVPKTKVLEKKVVIPSTDIRSNLHLRENEEVIFIKRLRFADDEPVLLVEAYLPYNTCKSIIDQDLESESLYGLLSKSYETRVNTIIRTIEADVSEKEESKLLKIPIGFPIQFLSTVAYNSLGKPVEYSFSRYRGDRNKFTVEIKL